MGADRTETANVSVLEGKLTVNVQAERPVMVFRDKQVWK
jgi:hypothetical protein